MGLVREMLFKPHQVRSVSYASSISTQSDSNGSPPKWTGPSLRKRRRAELVLETLLDRLSLIVLSLASAGVFRSTADAAGSTASNDASNLGGAVEAVEVVRDEDCDG
jgi:hypothetical protein